jgi:hypothetical protein
VISFSRRGALVRHLNERFGAIAEAAYPAAEAAIEAIEAGEPSRPITMASGDVHPALEVGHLLELGQLVHLSDDDLVA